MENVCLLDKLAAVLQLRCLSDLRMHKKYCYLILSSFELQLYTIQQWKETLNYIETQTHQLESYPDITCCIQDKLRNYCQEYKAGAVPYVVKFSEK